MNYNLRPTLTGFILGLLLGLPSFAQPIGLAAQLGFAGGLILTYTSIGFLVGALRDCADFSKMPKWLYGATVGALYSLPGAIFTAVPYPLREDAPAYYLEFAGGGVKSFVFTLVFGGLVGFICGFMLKTPPKNY